VMGDWIGIVTLVGGYVRDRGNGRDACCGCSRLGGTGGAGWG
jgi:hypothetical protein